MTLAKDLLIDIEANFSGDEVHSDLGTRRHSLRLRLQPHQVEVDARTRAIDRGIRDTYLQHELKDHPSAQA